MMLSPKQLKNTQERLNDIEKDYKKTMDSHGSISDLNEQLDVELKNYI